MRANKMTYNHEIGTYSLLRYKQFKFPLGCIDKIKDTPEKGYPNTELFECRQFWYIVMFFILKMPKRTFRNIP